MPIRSYILFAKVNAQIVGYGFLMTFVSSFGQTYFVGAFGPSIQTEFGLTNTSWGLIYMIGTLASAALLPWSGKQIDRLDLRLYTIIVIAVLAIACVTTALVTGPVMLVLAIFLLRQSGQGLASHTGITTMARYFDAERGRAIAIATLGFSVGQSFLPLLAVFSIGIFGWRLSYASVGIFSIIFLLPTVLWLLKDQEARHARHVHGRALSSSGSTHTNSWTRSRVLHDTRFWLIILGYFTPALILTAMFFHHLSVAETKGWSAAWMTGNYIVFSIAIVITSLIIGSLIDRIGAVRLVPFKLIPLMLAMIAIGWGEHHYWVLLYFIFAGVSSGWSLTAVAALWPELYGTDHIGAIKSLTAALSVFASALGPLIMGAMMDIELSIELICYIFAASTLIGTTTMYCALRKAANK